MTRPFACQVRVLRQFFATAIISLCLMSDGMQFGWQSPASKYLKSNETRIKGFNDNIDMGIQVIFLLGGVAFTPLVTYLSDKIGRKWTSICGSTLNLLSWISIAITTYAEVLLVSKLLASISYCFDMIVLPMYVSEISEKKIRGFLISYVIMSAMFGIIIIYVLFPLMPIYASSAVGASLNLIQISVFTFMHESPYFLVKKEKHEKAAESLQFFRGAEDTTDELKEIEDALELQKQHNAKLKDLFRDDHSRKALVIGCVLQFMVPLSGLSMLTMNLHTLLSDSRVLFPEDFTSIGFSCCLVVGQIICMCIIDYFGRKPLLLFSIISCNVTLFAFACYFTVRDFHPDANYHYVRWIPEVVIVIYAFCYRAGIGTVPTMLCAEMFPIKHKAAGLSITFVVLTVVDSLVIVIFKEMQKHIAPYYSFYIFIGISLLNFPFVLFLVPETKGRSLEDIQKSMGQSWLRSNFKD